LRCAALAGDTTIIEFCIERGDDWKEELGEELEWLYRYNGHFDFPGNQLAFPQSSQSVKNYHDGVNQLKHAVINKLEAIATLSKAQADEMRARLCTEPLASLPSADSLASFAEAAPVASQGPSASLEALLAVPDSLRPGSALSKAPTEASLADISFAAYTSGVKPNSRRRLNAAEASAGGDAAPDSLGSIPLAQPDPSLSASPEPAAASGRVEAKHAGSKRLLDGTMPTSSAAAVIPASPPRAAAGAVLRRALSATESPSRPRLGSSAGIDPRVMDAIRSGKPLADDTHPVMRLPTASGIGFDGIKASAASRNSLPFREAGSSAAPTPAAKPDVLPVIKEESETDAKP
jgi:hypothetical protein